MEEDMKTPEEYFDSLLSTDANCPVDVYAHKYNRADLFRFAEAYHKAQLRDELINYIKWLEPHRINEWPSDESIFVDEYLINP